MSEGSPAPPVNVRGFDVNIDDAGIGDPFWYEWTVGQLRLVDMLDPDSRISSVTFQASGVKGLDDVIVSYSDGRPDEAIQVKHTRVGDTLTFGDLVGADSRGQSLLRHLASSWRDITQAGKHYRAVLYTNRAAGVAQATVSSAGGERFVRPALDEFWAWLAPRLAAAATLGDLPIPAEWIHAWDEWTSALAVLGTDSARLEFLKSLEVRTDQPDLQALHDRVVANLARRFGVTETQAKSLAQALDAALRTWTTTLRKREPISLEDVFEVLCVPELGPPRDHALAPPAPFFTSRHVFVEDLAKALKARTAPVVFLSGPPGCGKTSIVSALANRQDPVVLLRFHAFRPITPGDTLLPEDAGRATTARALWGDYLSQLRVLLRGRLARFAVPVRNEFLSEHQLRDHVLRLSATWAAETRTTAVLAVDGLDHAARSQDPHHASLLKSLPSPEAIPSAVALLVAGQPPGGNPEYPSWLRGAHPNVLVRYVPNIEPEDVTAALTAQGTPIPAEDRAAAQWVIAQFAGGNTLSAMFGIYEAASCRSAQELHDRLQARRLSDGLSAYYDSIWTNAVQGAEAAVPLIGTHVAAALSLTSAAVTGALLRRVFPSTTLGVEQWHELLSRLTPLVVGSADGFRLHHNDVRVHLTRQLQNHQDTLLRTASGLAHSYVADPQLVPQKHAQAVRLFALCREWRALAELVSPSYVLEGWIYRRSLDELGDDVAHGLRAASQTRDWSLLHEVCCAALTLRQLGHSASALSVDDQDFTRFLTVPPLLPSEARVAPRSEWTAQLVHDVARDAWTLVRHSQLDRARQLLGRWFADLGPSAISAALPDEDRQVTQPELTPALELWGRACAHLGRVWTVGAAKKSSRESGAEAAFLSGELDEAVKLGGVRRIDAALQRGWGFDSDRVAGGLDVLLASERWRELVPFLRKLGPGVPSLLRLRLGFASLITRRERWSERFAKSFVTDRFAALADASASMDTIAHHVWLCVLLGWLERTRFEPHSIRDEALDALFSRRVREDRDRAVSGILFGAAATLGRALGALVERGPTFAVAYLPPGALGTLIEHIVDTFSAPSVHLPLGAHPAAVAIVRIASMLSRKLGRAHAAEASDVLGRHVLEHPLGPFEDTAWQLLSAEAPDLLGDWISTVLGDRGVAWNLSGTERLDVAQRFFSRARGTAYETTCANALEKMRWGIVSYAEHKDYSLDAPLQWFILQAASSPRCWETEGVRLLAISREADALGDNRLDSEIVASVFEAACSEGPSSVDRLLSIADASGRSDWLRLTGRPVAPEAFAAVASKSERNRDELRVMWCWSIGCLAWQEDSDRGALIKVREQLAAAAARFGFGGFVDEMRRLAPLEGSLSPPAGDSASAERAQDPVPPSTIEEAERLFSESPDTSPRLLLPLIQEAQNADARRGTAERVLRILGRRDRRYGWTYTGTLEVYEALMPSLSEDERWTQVADWVNTREYDEQDLWLEQAQDIDGFCRARARTDRVSALRAGTQRLLGMHETWRNGAGHLPSIAVPEVAPTSQVRSWSTLAFDALFRGLELGGVLDVSTAARGLYALCVVDADVASMLAARAEAAPERSRSIVLLLLERLAASHPERARVAIPFIQSAARSNELSTRLQAWVIVQQLTRSGVECESIPSHLLVSGDSPSALVAPRRPLLSIEETSEGRYSFSEPLEMVRHLFERVAAVTGDDLVELESAFSAWLPKTLPEPPKRRRSTRYWDVHLREDPLADAAIDFLGERARSGRWAGTPVVALAQAVLLGDDPWVLLRTGELAPNIDGWVIDDELDKAIEEGGKHSVLEKLAPLLVGGLREDEILIGAVLSTYSRNWDVELHYAHAPERQAMRQDGGVAGTYGGRSFSWYERARHQAGTRGWLTQHHGGRFQFPDETFIIVPSEMWTASLNWWPDPQDPTRWHSRAGALIRFDRYVGPYRSVVREPLERQPMLQRWVCDRETWDSARSSLGVVPLNRIRIEHSPFANQ